MVSLGLLLLVVGAVVTPLPPPFAFGAVMVIAGLAILAGWSKTARRWMQKGRARHPKFSGWLDRLGARLPRFLRQPLRRTHPAALGRLQRLQARLKPRHTLPASQRATDALAAPTPPAQPAAARPPAADSALPGTRPDR